MTSHQPTRWIGAMLAAVVAMTMISVTPVGAQAEPCLGGGPTYWTKNPWPEAFRLPKKFQQPRIDRTFIRRGTPFDSVYRWRRGRDQEGQIFPGKTLRQVIRLHGNPKEKLAQQAIAAMLNAGETSNAFEYALPHVIEQFQVYWDGTDDMSKNQARLFMKRRFASWNTGACPAGAPTQAD